MQARDIISSSDWAIFLPRISREKQPQWSTYEYVDLAVFKLEKLL